MLRKILFIGGVVLFVLLMGVFVGCEKGGNDVVEEEVQEGGGLKIVTSIPPLYSLTSRMVEGTEGEVSNIVPAGASVHTFQLKPSVAKEIESADLIVINGLELEMFLEDALDSSKGAVVDTSKKVAVVANEHDDEESEHEEEADEHDGEEEDEHHHGEYDPHIWLDPGNAVVQAEAIRDALIEVDGENKLIYEDNFRKLELDLLNLKEEIRGRIGKLEVGNYILFHDAYGYFEKAFGLRSTAVIQEFPGKEVSPQYLKMITDLIRSEGVEVIFVEPQFSPKLVETLASEYGVKVGKLDPLGIKLSADGYFEMMRKNVEEFESVFGN